MYSKSELRKVMLAKRPSIPEAVRTRHEDVILEHILSLPSFRRAGSIALYMPVRGEVGLLSLWRPEEKKILFPKVTGDDLVFSPAASEKDFAKGAYGIPEPLSGKTVEASEIDIIFVPGIAFDRYCHRLGYGKGYYDRLIKKYSQTIFIGVCLDEFCIERLPVDPWDARVDFVVTQAGIYKLGEVE
jgi:5-formyltetrahydrofolate cyclo-ligase